MFFGRTYKAAPSLPRYCAIVSFSAQEFRMPCTKHDEETIEHFYSSVLGMGNSKLLEGRFLKN
jgi:hypothetical protein